MRFNPLFLQVFYNRLLMPLEQISAQINTGEYESAITSALTIKMLLDNPDWSAFPDYQALLTKLPIQRSILSLLITLDDLKITKTLKTIKTVPWPYLPH
ncbi:MAG: hypothetical protein HWD59_12200 [Coxiellaceae bacterium]|nr:MAG: hypothetical protein HWD59_12200 [Coxiellaceae bacterium]